ncbi:hypothetical protein KI387_033478, partial [Taxus chinensis]
WKLEGDIRIEETVENQKIGQGQNPRTRLYGWNCGKPRYAKKDCWELRDKKKQQEENKEANVVSGNVCQDALILSLHNITESWVLDSGASFHATPHRHYFVDNVQGDFGH